MLAGQLLPLALFTLQQLVAVTPEREEGELLREATEKGVVNVARYDHHETVCVGGKEDDVDGNVRKGLDVTKASNAFRHVSTANKTEGKMLPQSTSGALAAPLWSAYRPATAKDPSNGQIHPTVYSS